MAAARILLLGDDAAKWTSGSWWGLSTCCVRDAAVQPEPPHPGGSGWLDWLLQSESGPVGETWVKKISFHQLPETLHLFSFGDCQCDNSQWKGCVCKWRKRIPEMQRQEGRCGWVSSGVGRPRRRHGRGGRPQGVGGGDLASMEVRTKTLSPLLCLSSPPSSFFPW